MADTDDDTSASDTTRSSRAGSTECRECTVIPCYVFRAGPVPDTCVCGHLRAAHGER